MSALSCGWDMIIFLYLIREAKLGQHSMREGMVQLVNQRVVYSIPVYMYYVSDEVVYQ